MIWFTRNRHEDGGQVKSRLLLDVIIRKSSSVFKLFTSEDKTLLIWRNTFLVLDLGLDVFNGIRGFNFKSDGFTSQCLHKNLHTPPKTENQMKGGFFLNVVIGESTAIFKLLTGEDKTLLVWWDTFFVLDLSLDIFDGI